MNRLLTPFLCIIIFLIQSCDPPLVTKPDWALKRPFIADVNLMVNEEFGNKEGIEPCCQLRDKLKTSVVRKGQFLGEDCMYDKLNKEERIMIFNNIASYIRKKKDVKSAYPSSLNKMFRLSKEYFEQLEDSPNHKSEYGLETHQPITINGEEIKFGNRILRSDTLHRSDTLLIVDPVSLEEKYQINKSKTHISAFNRLKFYEYWNLEKETYLFHKKIDYIGVTIPMYADENNSEYITDLLLLGLKPQKGKVSDLNLIRENVMTDILFDFRNDFFRDFKDQKGFDIIIEHLLKGVANGKLETFEYQSAKSFNGSCTPAQCNSKINIENLKALTIDDFFSQYSSIDTMIVVDPVTLEEKYEKIEFIVTNRDIIGLTFIEDWMMSDELYFEKFVKYVGLIEAITDNSGNIIGKRVRTLIQLPPGVNP